MASEAKGIEWKKEAIWSIAAIAYTVTEKGFPETSKKFSGRLYSFGESLLIFPDKYPICRYKVLAKHNMLCAVFERDYIFVYKVVKHVLIIYNVINVKALK
jgi:hypothetical protein